jgi:hypothetical protein
MEMLLVGLLQLPAILAALDGPVETFLVPDSFNLTDPDATIATFPDDFEFGLATAPAHVRLHPHFPLFVVSFQSLEPAASACAHLLASLPAGRR